MSYSLEKQREGVGVVFRESLEGIEVADLIKGGSAERSGQVRIGDFLIEVDGRPLREATIKKCSICSKPTAANMWELGLKRNDGATESIVKVDLKREKIILDDERVQFKTEPFGDGVIGKIMLPSFMKAKEPPAARPISALRSGR